MPAFVTIPAGQPSVTLPVIVIDDGAPEPAETVLVTLAAGSYTIKNPSNATVTIADDDLPGFTISAISGPTTENGGTATFTVVLNTQPVGGAGVSVTIPLSSNNTAEGTVSPASLTFTNALWNVVQTVTVTGVNDSLTDGNVGYQIDLGPTVSGDPAYDGRNPGPVLVTNNDNEPEVTIVATTPGASEGGTNGVFTVSRTGNTGSTLTVNYSISGTATNGADYTSLSGSVTIAAGSATATMWKPAAPKRLRRSPANLTAQSNNEAHA